MFRETFLAGGCEDGSSHGNYSQLELLHLLLVINQCNVKKEHFLLIKVEADDIILQYFSGSYTVIKVHLHFSSSIFNSECTHALFHTLLH